MLWNFICFLTITCQQFFRISKYSQGVRFSTCLPLFPNYFCSTIIHVLLIEKLCKFDDRLWPYERGMEWIISNNVGEKTCCFLWFSVSGNFQIYYYIDPYWMAVSMLSIFNRADINLSYQSIHWSIPRSHSSSLPIY